MPPTARRRTPSVAVRDALLRAGRQLLDQGGPAALGIRDIAAVAGVSPMGVYQRFGSKEGILNALLEQGFTDLGTAINVTPDPARPLRALATGMAHYREFAIANPGLYRLMFDLPFPDFSPSPTAISASRATFDRLIDAVRLCIATGDLRPDDPDELAQQIWAGCHGAVSLELRGIGFVADPASHYRNLTHTLIRGLAP
ncbi:TetR/AcrR family transcriptional regulator [Pseudonocardia acaciae]|uniref:TetR/AcrR family transcriptional regulator n=1 Tax=Pseudonocardia acaciae TaxID=551276 RepID=UPI000490689F|nr:TetR/AcrR family transcriptional regulator [Pseudonocardia acaciae]